MSLVKAKLVPPFFESTSVVAAIPTYLPTYLSPSQVQTLKRQADATTIIILVGNKLDLATSPTSTASEETSAPSASSSKRRVPKEMAERYAEEEGLMFMEASAKTGEGVEELFMEVGEWSKSPILSPRWIRFSLNVLPLFDSSQTTPHRSYTSQLQSQRRQARFRCRRKGPTSVLLLRSEVASELCM